MAQRRHHRLKTHTGWRLQSNPDVSLTLDPPGRRALHAAAAHDPTDRVVDACGILELAW